MHEKKKEREKETNKQTKLIWICRGPGSSESWVTDGQKNGSYPLVHLNLQRTQRRWFTAIPSNLSTLTIDINYILSIQFAFREKCICHAVNANQIQASREHEEKLVRYVHFLRHINTREVVQGSALNVAYALDVLLSIPEDRLCTCSLISWIFVSTEASDSCSCFFTHLHPRRCFSSEMVFCSAQVYRVIIWVTLAFLSPLVILLWPFWLQQESFIHGSESLMSHLIM